METALTNLLKNLKINEDTISTVLGGIVVVVIGLLVFNYFKTINTGEITPAIQEQAQPGQVELVEEEGKIIPSGLPTTYTVQAGDHLWKIAESFYNSGFNWTDIAQANNLTDANQIETGQQLIIPKVEVKESTVVISDSTITSANSIDGSSYTVQKGDHLWNIALRAYGDGYRWTEVYQTNQTLIGSNPSLIETGMQLTLPR